MLVKKRNNELPVWGDVFGNFFNSDFLNFPQNYREQFSNFPAANIKEDDNQFTIELAVPGKSKEDFNVDLNENTLTIQSEKRESKEEKEENFTRREFNFTSFRRSFRLPEVADAENIKASYTDGVLKVEVPKKEVKKPGVKTITIS